MDKYHLEIYHHDDFKTALASISSNSPFLTISVGDLVDTVMPNNPHPPKPLRITGIQHIIFTDSTGEPLHKVCIYVTDVGNVKDFLLTGKP